jgi:hypothetical protein
MAPDGSPRQIGRWVAVAPVLTRLGWRSVARNAWRLAAPSLVVLLPALVGEPGRTRFALVDQPFLPGSVSSTPPTRFAPVIGPGLHGGGPTRLVATTLAVGLAVIECRRRHDLPTVLAMCAVAFFRRVLFETELNWYYLWPVATLCLLLAARRSPARLAVCSAAVVASIVLGNHNTVHHIVLWWPALMASLVVLLAAAWGTSVRSALRGRAQPRAGGAGDAGGAGGAGDAGQPETYLVVQA